MTELAQSVDSVLQPWLAAPEPQATATLEQLLREEVEPLIREIVGYQFRVFFDAVGRPTGQAEQSDSEDVCSEVRLRVLARLRELRADPVAHGIRNLRSYAAVTAYRACYEYLRRKYPKRYGLKHKLRFLLSQHAEFAIWQTARGQWLTGLAAWAASEMPAASQAQLTTLQNESPAERIVKPDAAGLTQLAHAVFARLQQPVELDALVNLLAKWCGVIDQTGLFETPSQTGNRDEALLVLVDAAPAPSDTLAQRSYLARLWAEIRQMSPRHCAALLLNLRDEGGSATDLFVFTGVASFRQLAEALALEEAELAELWPQLPLDDLTIAARLGLTRQQVINLRRSARERLWRRMNDLK